MTDILEIPDDGDKYFRLGYQAAKDNRREQALSYLTKSYQLTQSTEALTELLALYYQAREIDFIISFIKDHEIETARFLENPTLAEIYLSIPLSSTDYDQALLTLYEFKEQIPSYFALDTKIQQAILQIRDKRSIKAKWLDWINDNASKLMVAEFNTLSAQQQLTYLNISYTLPFKQMKAHYQAILLEKHVLNFVKTDLLHYYAKQSFEFEFEFTWFNELKTLSNHSLIPLEQDTDYLQALEHIVILSEQENPHLTEMIQHALRIQVMIYYPFTHELLADPIAWYHTYLGLNGLQEFTTDKTDVNPNLIQAIQKANQEYIQLMEEQIIK